MNVMQIAEQLRVPSPAPQPQALAAQPGRLWVGSWATKRLYGIDLGSESVVEEAPCPGGPVGAAAVNGELRMICSQENDSRFIRRYVPHEGFSPDAVPCPEDTGSFVAHDGSSLWISQRYNKRVLQLDGSYVVRRIVEIGVEIIGIVWVDGALYLSTWMGAKSGGCNILRLRADQAPEHVAHVPFAGISLTHDGRRFWSNDFKANEIVAFELPG